MAKSAVLESNNYSNFSFGRVQSDVKMKRKTPSELREEQKNRRSGEIHADALLPARMDSDRFNLEALNVPQKPEPKTPKYINTRVSEVFPVKKSSESYRLIYGKERVKDSSTFSKTSNRINGSLASSFPPSVEASLPCSSGNLNCNISECSDSSTKENAEQGFWKIEKCSQNALRSVVELHMGNEKLSGSADVDMQKALKGLVARDILATSGSPADSSGKSGDRPSVPSRSFCSEFHIPERKIPLDFTLKTSLVLVSSSSVMWCHRRSATPASICHFSLLFSSVEEQNSGCASGSSATADAMYTNALHSWIYPQSSLPVSIISAMALATGKEEKDFLAKRLQDWEEAFRNLYYMLRKNLCNIFYVCTTQYVVLFVGGNFSGKKYSCNAYLSQSTHGLRSLLAKNDVHFSMPLCPVAVEQAAEADIIELSEIEKRNLGQTVHKDSMSDSDNSPQSLLAFTGNEDTHGLFDLLLNYRFFMNSFTTVDVPVLYAPVPFQNSALSVPEIRYKEIKRADGVLPCSSGSDAENAETSLGSSGTAVCHSIEIKDTILPPWTVSGICAAISLKGRSFESSFTTEPSTVGLNLALDSLCQKPDLLTASNKLCRENGNTLGIPEAVPVPSLRSSSLKRLKYLNGSYVAYSTSI